MTEKRFKALQQLLILFMKENSITSGIFIYKIENEGIGHITVIDTGDTQMQAIATGTRLITKTMVTNDEPQYSTKEIIEQ